MSHVFDCAGKLLLSLQFSRKTFPLLQTKLTAKKYKRCLQSHTDVAVIARSSSVVDDHVMHYSQLKSCRVLITVPKIAFKTIVK